MQREKNTTIFPKNNFNNVLFRDIKEKKAVDNHDRLSPEELNEEDIYNINERCLCSVCIWTFLRNYQI